MLCVIDMIHSDQCVLKLIRELNQKGVDQIPAQLIAERLRMHPNTVRRIIRKLATVGMIELDRSRYAGGFRIRAL